MSYDTNNKSPNVIVAGLWQSRNGHYHTMPIDDKGHEILKACFEKGGKFLVRKRTAEAIQGSKNPEKAPVAYLEFVPKEAVAEFEANRGVRNAGEVKGI